MIPIQSMPWRRRGTAALLLIVIVCGSVGCGLPVQWQKMASKLPEATREDPVYYILCIWQPSEGHGPDGKHTRGFAGQICFFTRRQETPVRVNGDVQITVYDDQGKPEDRGKPLHRWDFLGDAWRIHLHDGTLGPTYSVFIPYNRKTQNQAQCALRVCFIPENGHPIYSDTAAVILPGLLRKKEEEPRDTKPMEDPRTSLRSLTIPLKEKQKKRFSEMQLGESSMERVVAPTSELARRAAVRDSVTVPQSASASQEDSSAKNPSLPSLPSPPPQTLPRPVMPAKPLHQPPPEQPVPSYDKTKIGFRDGSTRGTSSVSPVNSFEGKQPAQVHPQAQPAATLPHANPRHPFGESSAAQSVSSGS